MNGAAATLALYVAAATAEIAGCFAFWAWLRLERSVWWVAPGLIGLVLFALLLTRIDSAFAGRVFAVLAAAWLVALALAVAGEHHVLRMEIAQEARAEASKDVAASTDWTKVAREVQQRHAARRSGALIERRNVVA